MQQFASVFPLPLDTHQDKVGPPSGTDGEDPSVGMSWKVASSMQIVCCGWPLVKCCMCDHSWTRMK